MILVLPAWLARNICTACMRHNFQTFLWCLTAGRLVDGIDLFLLFVRICTAPKEIERMFSLFLQGHRIKHAFSISRSGARAANLTEVVSPQDRKFIRAAGGTGGRRGNRPRGASPVAPHQKARSKPVLPGAKLGGEHRRRPWRRHR